MNKIVTRRHIKILGMCTYNNGKRWLAIRKSWEIVYVGAERRKDVSNSEDNKYIYIG